MSCDLAGYNLQPIGIIKKNRDKTWIEIDKKYIRGLKQIDHFSHLRIFWWYYDQKSLLDLTVKSSASKPETGVFACRTAFGPNPVVLSTVRIRQLDLKRGIIFIAGTNAFHKNLIMDIKAYMPVEERIKNVKAASWLPQSEEWYLENRQEINSDNEKTMVPSETDGFKIIPIGYFKKIKNKSIIEIKKEYQRALLQLDQFSHINIIWYFDRCDNARMRRILQCNPPYEAPVTGVFASRAPVRPNPLALSVVALRKVDLKNNRIEIEETDALADTPVIDIKAYVPVMDRVEHVRMPAWLSHWPMWRYENSTWTASAGQLKSADIQMLQSLSILETEDPHIIDKEMQEPDTKNNHDFIRVSGARQNNLKNIDVMIPKEKITVITGVSGSGKSSLAFDTLFAEGQRRYMQNFSSITRQAAGLLDKPDFDHIDNLLPAIAIEQKTISRNPRSTVGTISDIYDYLRLLYARIGTRHCQSCGRAIMQKSSQQLAKILLNLLAGTNVKLYAGKDQADSALKLDIGIESGLDENTLQAEIDKAYKSGKGFVLLVINDETEIRVTNKIACPYCDLLFFKLNPSAFSYNSPEGMCPECSGLGVKMDIDKDRVIVDPEKSLLDGASAFLGDLRSHIEKPNANWMRGEIIALAQAMNVDLELPWYRLPQDFREKALYGTGDEKLVYVYNSPKTGRTGTIERPAGGMINHLKRLFANSRAGNSRDLFKAFLKEMPCDECGGERLAVQGRLVTVAGKRYPEIACLNISQIFQWITQVPSSLSSRNYNISREIIKEMKKRLTALMNVGVHYITLNRPVTTLSGGEAQRIRLASQIGCGLSGLLYVLDEPSIGLHPKDHAKIINTMRDLQKAGNTVVVVEHDADTMLAADHIIDIGPGAGIKGGNIMATGSPGEIMENRNSLTGAYLKNRSTAAGLKKRDAGKKGQITINGAALHNLKHIDVAFPLGTVTCVTGVSGSGKSSLIRNTLVPALVQKLHGLDSHGGPYKNITGLENIDKVINVDQSPIGRSPRSNPATYIGVFDEIRKIFAGTESAKKNKFQASRFSFNNKSGRCPECEGFGKKKIEMAFMPDVWVLCYDCSGKRYNKKTLDIMYKDKNIADILAMDVQQSAEFFIDQPKIHSQLNILQEVGLDYLKLGQSALTLSGGEAQRLKLAKELISTDTGRTIYVLDEPTTGLHFADIQKLLTVLFKLSDLGNTVIIIEHNLDVIRLADWIIDLGPEGGDEGGRVVAMGTPDDITGIRESYTGQLLKKN